MAYRTFEYTKYTTFVICDNCGKEEKLLTGNTYPSFDTRMNGALNKGYTFKQSVDGVFKNYCTDCKSKVVDNK